MDFSHIYYTYDGNSPKSLWVRNQLLLQPSMLYCVDQQSTLIFTLYWQAHFDADYCNIHTTVAGQWVNRAKLQEWIIMTEITQQHPSNCKSKIQKQGVNWQKITQHTTLMMMMMIVCYAIRTLMFLRSPEILRMVYFFLFPLYYVIWYYILGEFPFQY